MFRHTFGGLTFKWRFCLGSDYVCTVGAFGWNMGSSVFLNCLGRGYIVCFVYVRHYGIMFLRVEFGTVLRYFRFYRQVLGDFCCRVAERQGHGVCHAVLLGVGRWLP